jgi:iron complex transport system substrate-binding protein
VAADQTPLNRCLALIPKPTRTNVHWHAVVRILCALLAPGTVFGLAESVPGTALPLAEPIPARIVSLVPSVTETLFAVGAGRQVVAVSSYDREPPEVMRLPRVGALIDPDVERIIALRPDLVIVYASQTDLREQLGRAAIRTWAYAHAGLANVLRTARDIGAVTGHAREGDDVARAIEQQLARVRTESRGRPHPKVLLVFGREPESLRNIYASGGIGFLHELLAVAGGVNVLADVNRESVQATTELILTRAPHVIVELRADPFPDAGREAAERAAWMPLASVPAVRNRRVRFLYGSEYVVPGPRIGLAAEKLAAALQ